MKTLAIGAAAAVALGLGAWIVVADSGGDDDDKPTAARPDDDRRDASDGDDAEPIDPSAYDDPALARRVASLEAEVKSLRRQIAMTQGARTALAPRGDAADLDVSTPAPALESAVREIYEEERSREREERDERRRERMEERTEEVLDDLVAEAGLDTAQRDAISAAWSSESDKIFPMFQEARSGDRDFGEVREEIHALREATDAEIEKQLSADQFEKYKASRPQGPGRGGPRGANRGGRGSRGGRGG